jgi:hypothetical protein
MPAQEPEGTTAAGLFFRKMHPDAFSFEQGDGVHPCAGKELVDDAGGKEIDILRALRGGFGLGHRFSVGKVVKPIRNAVEMYDTTDT